MADNEFVAVINDTAPKNNGRSYALNISGSNYNQFLGKKIGDIVDGIFVGEGENTLAGYKLAISGGSDKTGTPMRSDLEGGAKKPVLITAGTGFKGHKIVHKKGNRYRYKEDGMRKRRNFRGNVITTDTRQLNLKVVEAGNKALAEIFGGSDESAED